mgnify:CR=1 FL=1
MSFKQFCLMFGYDLRSDRAKESFQPLKLFINVIDTKKPDKRFLAFLGLHIYSLKLN